MVPPVGIEPTITQLKRLELYHSATEAYKIIQFKFDCSSLILIYSACFLLEKLKYQLLYGNIHI